MSVAKSKIRKHRTMKRMDGLENVLSAKNTTRSKTGSNYYNALPTLDYLTIKAIYESGGIGAKGLTRPADDITRKGFSFKETGYDQYLEVFEDLDAENKFNQAIRWARSYGGAIIVMIVNDKKSLDKPLKIGKTPYEIEDLEVYEAGCSWTTTVKSYYKDARYSNFGKPEIYEITDGEGRRFSVHESRCLRFDGRAIDSHSRAQNRGWMGSELQPVYEALMSMMSQHISGEEVLNEMVVGTLKIENLDAMLVDEDGENIVRKRIDLVDTSKSNENTLVIDANESFERHTVNLSGMSNIQHNSMTVVAGAFDIPATYLFGSSPDGQNATGESDKEQYYGKIESERKNRYAPALRKLFTIMTGVRLNIVFPSMRISNLFDSSRSVESVAKGLSDLVTAGILTTDDAKLQWYEAGLIKKISTLE